MSDELMLSVEDLVEKRKKEALEELGKMKPDDPNRQKLVSEIKTLFEVQNADTLAELTRLNNNARNELEERRMEIDEEKVKVDKKRIWLDIGKIVTAVACTFGGSFMSFHMEELNNAYKDLKRDAVELKNKLISRF